jgi:predicted phage terminase large subunit-like protein
VSAKPGSNDILLDDLLALSRTCFGTFVELFFPLLHGGHPLVHASYLDLMVEVLSISTLGGERNIIFNLPPGFMKSMLVSVLYPAWRLAVNPAEKIIAISYGDDLSHDLSRRTRMLMQHPLYRRAFPETILDKKAEDTITTTKGGQRYATSVGSDIAGFRADLIIIDDPMQPSEIASEAAKAKLRDWYFGVVAQRLRDPAKGVIILVMHRIAPDDLTSTFLEMGGWFQVSLPLVAEEEERYVDQDDHVVHHRRPGELLNPRRMSPADVEELRRKMPTAIFQAQYQQRPQYDGSGVCSIDRLVRYAKVPPFELTLHSWDVAATKDGGDWTACTKYGLAIDPDGRDVLYLIGRVRIRVELPDVRAQILLHNTADKPALILIDGNGIGLGVYQDLVRGGLQNLLRGSAMERVNAANLKEKRFQLALLNLYDGRVRIPMAMPGLDHFLQELATFPNGKHDDQVDSLAMAAGHLDHVIQEARRRAARR